MGAFDEIKGKAKEAAGKVTGNERLEDEGKADQVKSDVADAVKDGANKVIGSFKDDSDK
ncbi:MAG: CsbD family protein [Corynebacterium matruchotii]|uniref:CsbD family protein n=1 Tax=Corynebacterium matruchotii TaxID=43768 RepID=UPI003616FF3E